MNKKDSFLFRAYEKAKQFFSNIFSFWKKQKLMADIAVLVVGIFLISAIFPHLPIPYTLRLGIFSTSNWGVPESETYQVVDQIIERFEKEHPYIQVEYVSGIVKDDYSLWLSDQIVQGHQPDVFMVLDQDFNVLASVGALYPLEKLINTDQDVSIEQYYPTAVEGGYYDDSLYALPYQCNLKLMFVNKSLLEENEIPLPDVDWSLDDFLAICQKITEEGKGRNGALTSGYDGYTWYDVVRAFDLDLFDDQNESALIHTDAFKEAMQYMEQLSEYDQSRLENAQESGFDTGNTAFATMSLAEYKTYHPYPWKVRKYSTFEWYMLPMPAADGARRSTILESLLMGISSTTSHPQAAWDLLKLFCNDEQTQTLVMEKTGGISSLSNLKWETEDLQDTGWNSVERAIAHTRSKDRFKKYEEAMNLLDIGVQQVLHSSSDLDFSLLELQEQINSFLRE